MTATYARLCEKQREIKLLGGVNALLGWDQETYMPPKAAEVRSEQLALLAGLIHDRVASPEIGGLLAELEKTKLEPEPAANVRETRRFYDRETKLPKELVSELARTCSLAQEAWVKARKANDFPAFAPFLTKLLELKREAARKIDPSRDAYDVLLDEHEPGMTTAQLTQLFSGLAAELAPLVKKIVASPKKPRVEITRRKFPREKQEELGRLVARDMGFDFEAGRLDVSPHPFCSGFAPSDVRITTRYKEDEMTESLFGIMHEAGHGLYEQGFRPEHFGTPLAEACSTGVHESQSRLWENMVGRSRAFWRCYWPTLKTLFPGQLADVSESDWVFAINEVVPSLIRTEADEVTYNLHVIVRFEIERDLLSGRLPVADLPHAWNAKMQALLGVTPPTNSDGCLQDVHWSFGAFAYFPTYTLGNLYAAQLHAKASKELDLEKKLEKGELAPLKQWLRENVHRKGMFVRPAKLIEEVTGKPPRMDDFVAYLKKKYGELYGV
jgi:carboxypeptidase Taq